MVQELREILDTPRSERQEAVEDEQDSPGNEREHVAFGSRKSKDPEAHGRLQEGNRKRQEPRGRDEDKGRRVQRRVEEIVKKLQERMESLEDFVKSRRRRGRQRREGKKGQRSRTSS